AAADGAPVLRLLGLPDDRLLRTDQPLRLTPGPDAPDRYAAPARDRRDPRLGAVPLPDGRGGARPLRRHAPVRARRSAPGPAPPLEQLHLQLRSPRGAQLPAVERDVLARPLPRRHAARRCGRLDALSRLLAAARGVDPQPPRGSREPRGDRVPASAQPRGL